jgi:hypothetical protein
MEARRAQGILDHELIFGLPSQQWKIIGNSVARSVSLALGLSLRQAWLSNSPELIQTMTSSISAQMLDQVQNVSQTQSHSRTQQKLREFLG